MNLHRVETTDRKTLGHINESNNVNDANKLKKANSYSPVGSDYLSGEKVSNSPILPKPMKSAVSDSEAENIKDEIYDLAENIKFSSATNFKSVAESPNPVIIRAAMSEELLKNLVNISPKRQEVFLQQLKAYAENFEKYAKLQSGMANIAWNMVLHVEAEWRQIGAMQMASGITSAVIGGALSVAGGVKGVKGTKATTSEEAVKATNTASSLHTLAHIIPGAASGAFSQQESMARGVMQVTEQSGQVATSILQETSQEQNKAVNNKENILSTLRDILHSLNDVNSVIAGNVRT